MAPSVLLVGIPANSPIVPEPAQAGLKKMLDKMDADLEASPYDYESLYINPGEDPETINKKLREKKWDVVVVGSECSVCTDKGILTMSRRTADNR